MHKLKLYHYWRSSCSWRVRWALALKGVACEMIPVSLLDGESESAAHLARNPLGYVPVLEIETPGQSTPRTLTESMAILQWLEETYPQPTLLPGDAFNRARIRQLCEIITADTQPLQNLNAMHQHSSDPQAQKDWARHWIRNGLKAYEAIVQPTAETFSVGNSLTLADLCLVPQCYNALRFEIPLTDTPTIARIHAAAIQTESYRASAPERYEPPK